MNQSIVDRPLLTVVLGTDVPTGDALQRCLETAFPQRISNFGPGTQPFMFSGELDGEYLIHLTVIDGPVENPDEALAVHPVLTGDPAPLQNIRSQVLVSVLPSNDRMVDTKGPGRIDFYSLHAQVTAALAELPGTIAVHSVMAQATITKDVYIEGARMGYLCSTSVSVWLTQGHSGINAYTLGMTQAGHPELQVVDSSMDVNELFQSVEAMAQHALTSQPLKDGDTLAFSADAPPVAIESDQWLVDPSVPALRILL